MHELGPVILADTVGFIRHLPHDLVDAFRATLEEVCEADALLHVVDVNDERMQENIAEVNRVLASIGGADVPQIVVFNKIDLSEGLSPHFEHNSAEQLTRVWVSAKDDKGIPELHEAMLAVLGQTLIERELVLSPTDGRLRAAFYELDAVLSEAVDEAGNSHLRVRLPKAELEKLFR